ncbi:MAG TPA: DHH family phosphoesterase [Thermodesulfovibrionales bacterium]|nr:DHH family phosphoesterase [Thermodesulfovibrionales bacterium]
MVSSRPYMNRRWFISRANPEYVRYLSKAASISPILTQVLLKRGFKTPGDITDFLTPGLAQLTDPYELPHMKAAVERIKGALKSNERVLVHGDYDTDGLTAASIMVHALRVMGLDARYFIPNRMIHGYGFNQPGVDEAKKTGVKLIITVDCGITSFAAAAYAKKEGIDVIITDHHEPNRRVQESNSRSMVSGQQPEAKDEFLLPDATVIVNPKLGKNPGLSVLSGAGIAFKMVQAFAMDDALPVTADDSLSLLDLAALGTLADVVPLTGENRIILKEGLRSLQHSHRPGIRSLLEVSGLKEREVRSGLLSFTLVPRINASGRMGDASDVMRLFLSDSEGETLSIAERLDMINAERQRIEEEVYQEALSQLNRKGYDAAIVLYDKGWHAGVTGIVASRVAEEFFRPTFVFSVEDTTAKGSVRSIPPFDVYRGLSACSDLLLSFGGHRQAAGVKLNVSHMPLFEERMNTIVRASLSDEDFIRTVEIDAEVFLLEVTNNLIKEFSVLEPLGFGNPEPLLGAKELAFLNPRVVGKNHLKMTLRQTQGKQRSLSMDAIGFSMGKYLLHLDTATTLDAAFTPMINEWNGNKYLQLHLKALRPSPSL